MRLLMWGGASAALGLAVAGDASAERYLVSVVAGPNGELPEPGAPLLAAIGGAVLLAARAGSRRTR